jgi:hypothetical protein
MSEQKTYPLFEDVERIGMQVGYAVMSITKDQDGHTLTISRLSDEHAKLIAAAIGDDDLWVHIAK